MGALHAGHLHLVEVARRHADRVVVSIFVNPTQFGPHEDLSKYPRQLDRDLEALSRLGADLVFAPSAPEMYPPGEQTRVNPGSLARHLCGPFRPGHFEGVATIVTKLLAIVGECTAVFGRKDYQQLRVVEQLARDLLLPVRVVGVPTVRDADGLALSSRNAYLSPSERAQALSIPRALASASRSFSAGLSRVDSLIEPVRAEISRAGLRVQYAEMADPERLIPLGPQSKVGPRALVAVAAFCGTTRLIDNLVLGEDSAPQVAEPAAEPS
jgi:pantoate--beta-alanine ligase